MPTEALRQVRAAMQETEAFGMEHARTQQVELGRRVRTLFAERGLPSVAAPGFDAPGVVVSYTMDPDIQSGKKFLTLGLQTAAGVPLQCDEPADYRSFRVGLFGLDKLDNIDRTVGTLKQALDQLVGVTEGNPFSGLAGRRLATEEESVEYVFILSYYRYCV